MGRGWSLCWWGAFLGSLTLYHLLVFSLISPTTHVEALKPLAELKTKQLLTNIRSHLAKQVDEVVQQKECDSGLTLCEPKKEKEEASPEVGSGEELPPPPKIRGFHKPAIKVNPKDVIQNMIHKVKVHNFKKLEPLPEKKPEARREENSDEKDDDDDEDDEKPKKPAKKSTKEDDDKPEQKKKAPEPEPKKSVKKSPKDDDGGSDEKPKKKKKKEKEEEEEEGINFPGNIPVFSPTSSAVQSQLCRKHGRLFLRQLQRYKMWALLMYDASAKLPSGILQGNTNQYGDFDECLSVNAVVKDKTLRADGSNRGIQGRYCLASIDIEATEDEGALKQAVYRAQAYGFIKSSAEDSGHFIPRFTTVNWGVCVPSSCSPADVEKALNDELSIYNETAGVSFSVVVDEDACVDKEDLEFSFSFGLLFSVFFYLAVISAAAFATYRDIFPKTAVKTSEEKTEENVAETKDDEKTSEEKTKDDEKTAEGTKETQEEENQVEEVQVDPKQASKLCRILSAFSLKRTTDDLLCLGTDDDISCIHGIKAIFTAMLYIAHKTAPLALTPYHNRIQLTKLSNEAASTILRTSIIYTDSFLLVSGVLTSFNMAREVLSHGRIAWAKRIASRLVRLTPPLFAVLLFYGFVAPELGSGPMWGTVVGKNAELCRSSGWTNLFYIQNFFDFQQMCAPQTHQLALDMQLSLTAPLLVYVLFKYDLLGLLVLQFIFLFSSALRYITTSSNELTLVFYHGVTVSQLYETANLLYSQAIYRATPYVLGVTLGYYLQKQGSELQQKLHKPLAAIGWIAAACFALLSIVTPAHLADREYEYDSQEAAQYAALSPIAWSLALGWIIAACHLGYGGRLNEILSSRPLLILSRISYSVYLIQFLVFNHNVASIRVPKTFSIIEALNLSEIATITILSVIVTLLFDLPMKELKTILMESWPARKTAEVTEQEGEASEEPNEEPIQPVQATAQGEPVEEKRDSPIVELPLDHEEEDIPPEPEELPEYEDEEDLPAEYEEEVEEEEEELDEELEDEDAPLRRSSRIRFDEDEDQNFWVDDTKSEAKKGGEDDFWGKDDD